MLLASVGLTIIALPFAIYFGVTMQFFIQAVILEHEKTGLQTRSFAVGAPPVRNSFARSACPSAFSSSRSCQAPWSA